MPSLPHTAEGILSTNNHTTTGAINTITPSKKKYRSSLLYSSTKKPITNLKINPWNLLVTPPIKAKLNSTKPPKDSLKAKNDLRVNRNQEQKAEEMAK